MLNYNQIKKLDEKSLQKITEGPGPADECICSILSPPEVKKGFAASVKKAFSSMRKKSGWPGGRGRRSVEVPLTFDNNQPEIRISKEVVKRQKSCGKCGCDSRRFVVKHSYANIRITTPDISSLCPCSSNCLPDKEKLQNNIKVLVENAQIDSKPDFQKGLHTQDSPTKILKYESSKTNLDNNQSPDTLSRNTIQ